MIILYNPQSSANRKPILPMSLLAVGAVLEDKYEYRIIDGNLEDEPLAALDAALREAGSNPILGMTVMPGPQLEQAIPLCRTLKGRYPDLTVIWGGYFPTQHWDVVLNADYVDYVVRGHSEYVLLQLLGELERESGPDLPSIPGLAYRDGDGVAVTNALAPIPHPSKLPKWNFERVETAEYVRPTFLGSRTLGYHSSYGCPFFCNFCAVVNMVNGRWFPESSSDGCAS
jgi:radical SAM superfamily enzyme YgiQ (UPF0313 family)